MSEIPSTIGDEVNKQLGEVRAKAAPHELPTEEWTAEDQATLEQELNKINFDPAHANPDFPDLTVTIKGKEIPIHKINNFPMILGIMDKVRHGKELQALTFEATYASVAPERKYVEIFDRMEAEFPALYIKIKQIDMQRQQADQVEFSSKELDERDYLKSQGFSAAAGIAKELDPDYDMQLLNP